MEKYEESRNKIKIDFYGLSSKDHDEHLSLYKNRSSVIRHRSQQ